MLNNETHLSLLKASVRQNIGRVELFNGSTLLTSFKHNDKLKEFSVERAGANKFFGYGLIQKANIKLLDVSRELDITTSNSFKLYINDITNYPKFTVTEVNRDENTNELSITCYDVLYWAKEHTVAELILEAPYTIQDVAIKCAELLGLGLNIVNVNDDLFATVFEAGANLEGTETITEVLNAIAEATLTIYYVDYNNNLVFKRLEKDGEPVLTITKADYITLDSKTNRRLSGICSATELGDNVIATLDAIGTTQYIRNNPFWELRDDIDIVVEDALAIVGGLTINQFNCKYRGNYLLDLGDKIALVTKDNNTVSSYVLNSKIKYNGGLEEELSWSYEDNTEDAGGNPTTLGEALKLTYAKVDKANKEINIVVDSTSTIKLTTDYIQQSVTKIDGDVAELTKEVNTKMSADEINYSISSAMSEGVEKVTTSTGFTFNEEGLHISKTDSEITTSITEDGMQIFKNDDAVLTADNEGVKAEDLHATTYLIIGSNSRIEDYGSNRTGCFWIGG